MVCWLYNIDHWQFLEGWHKYVSSIRSQAFHLTYDIGFVAFDIYKGMLADAEGKISGPATVVAGFGAGATESLLAVTPFESIKTQL